MIKFESDHNSLEVVSYSRYLPGYLNRQIITLLSTLGVKSEVFERLQKEMINSLDLITKDEEKAKEFLKLNFPSSIDNAIGDIKKMLESGFEISKEPYLRASLEAIRAKNLKLLKEKTRIFVKESCVLMGVADETGILNSGEVFIQIKENPKS